VKAIIVDSLEGPSAARWGEAPEPAGVHERARGERLLVDVHAAGLSAIDPLQSRGAYQYGAPPPYIAGSEIAGVVREASAGSRFAVGDRVASIVFWGGMAERCLAAPDYTVSLPESMSFTDGAAVYLNYSTAWFAFERAQVSKGDTVLVHGAAGGVGTAALDLARVFGARTIAVVSSDDKERTARQAGAWEVVRSDGDWLERVRTLTGAHGVDVVLDPVGGDRFTDSLRALRIGGTLVVIGFVGGSIPEVKVNRLLLRNLTITGISMDTMDREHPGTLERVRNSVEQLLADGQIHPRVGERFAFADGAAALARVEEGSTPGKVVVEVVSD
jgi:NADPH2:quinone reductase